MADFFNVHDFGAVGDGVTDDAAAIRAAITEAAGRTVLFESNKIYLVKSPIDYQGDVYLKSNGAGKATIFHNGQAFRPLTVRGQRVESSKLLTASMQRGNRGWVLNNSSGIQRGQLMEVESSASWYHDPRPNSTDARKSELHRVAYIVENTVFTEDPANDGYNLETETVEVTFINPIKVHIENIGVQCVLPPAGESTPAISAVRIDYATESSFINVDTIDSADQGLFLNECYNAKVLRGNSLGHNSVNTGYGLQLWGCSNIIISERSSWGCHIGIDISGGHIISRDVLVEKCKTTGGGRGSKGKYFGFTEDGIFTSESQKGFTTHGAVDHLKYVGNTVTDILSGFSTVGRNVSYFDNYLLGRIATGFEIGGGENHWIRNNRSYDGWSTLKDGEIHTGWATVNDHRMAHFLTFGSTFDGENVYIDSNDAQVNASFVRIVGSPGRRIDIKNNTVEFASPSPDAELGLVSSNRETEPYTINSWNITDNRYTRIGGSSRVALFKDVAPVNCYIRDGQSYSDQYTPTVTLGVNATSADVLNCIYSIVGDIVTVSGSIHVKPATATQLTTVRLSPPVAINFTGASQCAGTVSAWDGASGAVSASSTDDTLQITFTPKTVDQLYYRFICRYRTH